MVIHSPMKPLLLILILCTGFAHASQGQVVGPEPLYKSRVLKSGDEERLVSIEVALNKRDLYLIVSSDGNASHDWASWIEPEVVMKDGTILDLSTYNWRAAFNQVKRGKTYRGGTMMVAGKEYTMPSTVCMQWCFCPRKFIPACREGTRC